MATAPLVFIIILNWNGKEDTLDCLRSLREVDYSRFKILVVDNASKDGSVEAIKKEFPDIEIIVNAANLRFAGGNNVGMKRAIELGADYLLLLNNDTIVDKDFLTKLVDGAEVLPQVGMAGPKIYYHKDPKRLWYAGGKIAWWKGWISHRGVREFDNGQYNTIGETEYITGCCVLVKREVIDKIGMLDEAYFIYGEDADWSIRASRAGYKLMYVPTSFLWHKVSVSSGGHLSWFKNSNKLKSQLRLMARYAKPYHWLTIPIGMVVEIIRGYINVKKGY